MIELHNVSKAYTLKGVRKVILDSVDYRFPHGRNVAIVGENGIGKSTLIRLIAGAEQPDRGRIYRSVRVSWPLGFAGGFNGSMTGLENILFVARIYGADTEEVTDYVKEFSELGDSLRLPIKTYSSGMKARLAFGLSMAMEFDCYLIDETTAVGDERFKKKCKQAFAEKLECSQIIMASHSAGTIKSYCDCGLFMTQDGLQFYDDVDTLIEDYRNSLA